MLLTYHYKRYILQISLLIKKLPLGTSFLGCSPSNCTYSTLQTNYNQSTRYLRNGYEILCFPVIFNITFLLFLIFGGTDANLFFGVVFFGFFFLLNIFKDNLKINGYDLSELKKTDLVNMNSK